MLYRGQSQLVRAQILGSLECVAWQLPGAKRGLVLGSERESKHPEHVNYIGLGYEGGALSWLTIVSAFALRVCKERLQTHEASKMLL